MFEKQFNIKDKAELKNKISKAKPDNLTIEYKDSDIIIKNKKGKEIFAGEIKTNPMGCNIKGNFAADKILSVAALIIVVVYLVVLMFTYFCGIQFYDYQIFLMVCGAAAIVIISKISNTKSKEVKDMFDGVE